ncbi:MAG: major capsid protein [Desulfobacteraceae bacterium]|nr:major capsid protein [Desulfobacteraceae bacterium]
MEPKPNSAIIRPDLGGVVDEFKASMGARFISLQVMPAFPVAKETSGFPVIPREALLRLEDTRRNSGGSYNRSDFGWENGLYATRENGWEEAIDDRLLSLYGSLFDVEMVKSRRATRIILSSQEKRIADKTFDSSRFAAHALGTQWSASATATPFDDINDAKLAVEAQCGMQPNTLIISSKTFPLLLNCDQMVDRIKYTFPGIDINNMTTRQLAQALGIENVLVGGGVYSSADKGQDATIARFWPDDQAMLTITTDDPDISVPCIGRTFFWAEESGENEGRTIVETYRDETVRSEVVRVRHDSDERLLASYNDSGVIVSDIADAVSYRITNVQ